MSFRLQNYKKITEFRNESPVQRVVTVIEQFMTVVKDSLAHGENVYLRGFGSFIVKRRAEKTALGYALFLSAIIFLLALMMSAICSVYSHIPLANARHWIRLKSTQSTPSTITIKSVKVNLFAAVQPL